MYFKLSLSDENKKYESFRIPGRQQTPQGGAAQPPQAKAAEPSPLSGESFYEMEYEPGSVPAGGRSALTPQKIGEPEKDPIRDRFTRMRNVARAHRVAYDFSRFYDWRIRLDNAAIFHEQGLLMKDFEDDFAGYAPFTQYFPYYQMMGYEQLRTYFTWRTKVRKGVIADTSLSYAFLYIYELLGNIGVDSPQDGLNRLVAFWQAFRVHNPSVDKYVLRWLKDYHIYYELPRPFREFVETNGLSAYYPKMAVTDDFTLFCAVSKYDIRKSAFFTDEIRNMIVECFSFVMERIRRDFASAGMQFDEVYFRPTRKLTPWKPFQEALFHPWMKQPDRRVVLSENEIYLCKDNKWVFSTVITTEKGKLFIGYVMKQMEAELRKAAKYKHKLTANIGMVHEETLRALNKADLHIETIVPAAVAEFFRDLTKTVVRVDPSALARIRQEALATQGALIVEEQPAQSLFASAPAVSPAPDPDLFADLPDAETASVPDAWDGLKSALDDHERQALAVVLRGGDIRAFADQCGVMTEVLLDGINEKAMDCIGDNLMDEGFALYDDYKEQVKELIP